MVNKKPSGTIWTHGIHQLHYGGKPTRLHTSKSKMPEAYTRMQETIDKQGYIPLGLDHLPEETLKQNPILKKTLETANINPHDVGQITKIGLIDNKIKITESQITNPYIQKLYDDGELPAYSIVMPAKVQDCPTGHADKIVSEFSQPIQRVDFVMAGGCKDCLVESDMITAKLSNGGPNMPENEDININEEEMNETSEQTEEESTTEETSEDVEETEEEENEETEAPLTLDTVKQLVMDIVQPLVDGNKEVVTAKLAEIETSTRTNKLSALVDKKIEAGYATPAMKPGLIATGLHVPEEEFETILASLSTKVWDDEQNADTNIEASESETNDSLIKQLEAQGYFK